MSSNSNPSLPLKSCFIEEVSQYSDEQLDSLLQAARSEQLRRGSDQLHSRIQSWSDEALDARHSALNDEMLLLKQERDRIVDIKTQRRIQEVFEDNALLQGIFQYIPHTFRFTAPVSKTFHANYLAAHQNSTHTTFRNAVDTIETAQVWMAEGGNAAKVCDVAVEHGRLSVLQYLHANHPNLREWETMCLMLAHHGQLECLKWARQVGCEWDSWTCKIAAENGHLECLKWARRNGCVWTSLTCAMAAANGHLDCLQWARQNGCDWDAWTCTSAAAKNHLDCLQWARENGCDWDDETCTFAARNGSLETLQWAIENGCDWDRDICLIWASGNGHEEVEEWLESQ